MSKLFYLSEVLKFAVEKEQEAYDLYNHLAEHAPTPELKELFEMLKGAEIKHKEYYSELLGGVESEQSPGVTEDEQYKAYMQELIASSRSVAKPAHELAAAMDFAIAREKDSILFYVGLKNFVPATAHGTIDEIIKEEAQHAALIAKAKTEL